MTDDLIALLASLDHSGVLNFLIVDAVWTGVDRDACREAVQKRAIGACWPFAWERLAYFTYGSYPIPQRWRVDIVLRHARASASSGCCWLKAPRRDLRRLLLLYRAADLRPTFC